MSGAPKNESLDALYMAVGRAISKWAAVENQLYHMFAITTSLVAMQPGGGWSADLTIPSAVLEAIDGFQGKLNMIRASLRAALRDLDPAADALLRDGLAEIEAVRALQGNRNKLAHWSAQRATTHPTGKLRPILAPPPFSSNDHQGVVETDIDQWSANFVQANRRLAEYVERLASHRGLQGKHLELTASQVRCTLPSDRTLLERLKQQLSDYL
jgi:hypothetical protein